MCLRIVWLWSWMESILITWTMRPQFSSPSVRFLAEEYRISTISNFSVEQYIISDSPVNTTRCIEFWVEEYDPYTDSISDVGVYQSPKSVSSDTQRTNLWQDETLISDKQDNKSVSPFFFKRVSQRISRERFSLVTFKTQLTVP